LVPEKDAVLISMNNGKTFCSQARDLSRGGHMYTDDPSAGLRSEGRTSSISRAVERFSMWREHRSNRHAFLAFQFLQRHDLDIAELRKELAQMDMLNSRLYVRQ